jgi:hypothetical protein
MIDGVLLVQYCMGMGSNLVCNLKDCFAITIIHSEPFSYEW